MGGGGSAARIVGKDRLTMVGKRRERRREKEISHIRKPSLAIVCADLDEKKEGAV